MTEPELHPFRVLTEEEEEGPAAEPAGVVDELFAIQVRETRERLKMSQGELARQMSTRGFPYYQQTVRRIEDSRRKVSVGEAKALAEILGTTIDRLTEPVPAEETGYREPTACAAAGITRRQLDYWAQTGLVEPSVRVGHGSGSRLLYSFRDILVLKIIKRLLDTGISLQQIRAAVQHLRDRGSADLAQVTLMSDGSSVYECTSADQVVELLQGGQGVFGIALGRVWREVEADLAALPAVRAEDDVVDPDDLRRGQTHVSALSAIMIPSLVTHRLGPVRAQRPGPPVRLLRLVRPERRHPRAGQPRPNDFPVGDQIVCAVLTGITNPTSESLNRLAKLEARLAYRFRNPANQRRRIRIACTRGTRRPITHRNRQENTPGNRPETPSRLTSKSHLPVPVAMYMQPGHDVVMAQRPGQVYPTLETAVI